MLRSLTRNLHLFTNGSCFQALSRTMFTEAELGIDKFKEMQTRNSNSNEIVVEKFKKALNAKKLISKDVLKMLDAVRTDEDVELFITGLKEFIRHDRSKKPFNFGAPVMRLLYTLDKTDLALDLLLDEKTQFLLTPVACTVVATQLYNKSQFDDVVRLTEHLFAKIYTKTKTVQAGTEPLDLITLTTASLARIGDAAALAKLKDYFKFLHRQNVRFVLSTIVHGVLLSLKHGDVKFANEVSSIITNQSGWVAFNLKLLILSRLNINEAVDLLDSCRTTQKTNQNLRVNRSTINELKQFVEKTNNVALLKHFNDAVKYFESVNCVNREFFDDIFFRPRTLTEFGTPRIMK